MQAKQDATELQEKSKEMKGKIKEAEEAEKQVSHSCPLEWHLTEESRCRAAPSAAGGLPPAQARTPATHLLPVSRPTAAQLSEERDAAIVPIGNLVPDSVPLDDNEVRWAGGRERALPAVGGQAGAPCRAAVQAG